MIFDPQFLPSLLYTFAYFPLFLFAIFFAFYIPGMVAIRKVFINKSFFETTVVSFLVGLVLWVYQAMVFGYLDRRELTYVYLVLCFAVWFKQQLPRSRFLAIKKTLTQCKINWILFVIFAVGIFGQTQAFFIAGQILSDGIRIFSSASDDAFWHLGLTAEIVRRIPPVEPGLSGVLVHNYHYWGNIAIGELVRVFHLPLLPTQFQYMYIFVSFLLGGIAYTLGKSLRFSPVGVVLFVYFQYFASDIIYLITIFTSHVFVFNVHPLEDGTMFLENPPRAFAIVVALGGVIFLAQWLRDKRFMTGFLLSLLFGSLIGFKVHTGIPVIGGLGMLSLYFLIKRQWRMLIIPIITVCISIAIYLPVNRHAGLPFIAPFEMSRTFSAQTNLFLSHFELARRIYEDHHNFFGELRIDIIMFIIFLIAQFGIRNVGFILLPSTIKHLGISLSVFFYSCIGVAIIAGTFFYQSVAGADIFNFYLTASLFLSILAVLNVSNWFDKRGKIIKIFCILLLLVITIPRWVYKTNLGFQWYFIPGKPVISTQELQAMEFISKHTDAKDVVLVFNYGQWDSMFSYVSTFTKRDMYLSGQVILGRHGIPVKDRAEVVKRIENSDNSNEVRTLINKNNIRILYFYGKPVLSKGLAKLPMKIIFQNNSNTVYRVN